MSGMMAAAPFPFRPRNLILSSSSAFLPPRVPRLAMLPTRIAMDKRLSVTPGRRHEGVVAAAYVAGSSQFHAGENENPYEILGISPLDGFDQVKIAYKRRRKDAESSCNWEHLVKLERAYDMVMMDQLLDRKKGVAYGSIQILKIHRKGPAYKYGNISSVYHVYIYPGTCRLEAHTVPVFFLFLPNTGEAEGYRASYHSYNEYGEVEGRGIHMAKRVLLSLGLVLGSILAVSLGYTGLANFSQFLGQYIPSVVYNFQGLIVTTASSVLLCILASYYR